MMSRFDCLKSRKMQMFGALALAALCGQPLTVHAAAVWSTDAAALGAAPIGAGIGAIGNNFNGTAPIAGGLTLANGNSYTFAGTFSEITTPGVGGTSASALMVINNFTITAAAGNIGNISDTMWFFSDVFPTVLPTAGFVGMSGAFIAPLGSPGSVQAEMDYNGSFGGLPATAFLTTVPAFNNPAALATPFVTLTAGFIPVATTELTGLLAFTLAPGESVTLPFDFSDNVSDLPGVGSVPEPSSVLLLGVGAMSLAVMAGRRMTPRKPSTVVDATPDTPEV